MMSTILEIDNLSLKLDGTHILKSISCAFPRGKVSVIIGPSGAGKSSLLQSITRLLPSKGTIKFDNSSIEELNLQNFRRDVVYVSQVPVVFAGTVEDNINWGRKIWNMEPLDPANQLALVGLSPDLSQKTASDLSVGQQQRLHLARSLAVNPRILLLDEPASGLDAISKEVFEDLIVGLQEEQEDLTVIMITHDLEQAKRVADYAILMADGEKKLEAPSEIFFKQVHNMSEADMLRNLLEQEGSS